MLVLSRKSQESIQIGSDIQIRIISIRGNTVRIGIDAPAEVSILRGELAESPRASQVLDLHFADGSAFADGAAALVAGDCFV
jgi:carbon storage regulator CsrA